MVHLCSLLIQTRKLTTRARNNSWSLLVSIIFIVVFCAVAWFASPKGETQTYVLAPFLSLPGPGLARPPPPLLFISRSEDETRQDRTGPERYTEKRIYSC
jgi:hypothetical protein